MRTVLTSWKEITQYPGKGVQTVQRCEIEFGLPIHRARGGHKRAILAIPRELDVWVRGQEVGHPGSMEDLRCETAALRAENAALKLQLGQSTVRNVPNSRIAVDYDVLARSAQLITETTRLKKYTDQVLAFSRISRSYCAGQPGELWSTRPGPRSDIAIPRIRGVVGSSAPRSD